MERARVLIDPTSSFWLAPFFLYAETHYRFRYFPSFLKKSEPELIADLPHRIEPGYDIPLLIIAKDAHRYPTRLLQIAVELRQGNKTLRTDHLLDQPLNLDERLFSRVFHLRSPHSTGWLELNVVFTIEALGVTSTYHNDNHVTSSRRPLRVFLSEHRMPVYPGLFLGDPHTHSTYTDDQVEFGSPIKESRELSRAMGLSFFCVTDHSYDLDDRVDSFLVNDPALPNWVSFQKEVDIINAHSTDFVVVRGEEVSCRNASDHNVHFLVFGQREFIHGSGDGAEDWSHTRSEHSIQEVIRQQSTHAVGFAAHAQEPVPILQRLLLGRRIWSFRDLKSSGLVGLQIVNGKLDKGFQHSYQAWIRLLLSGSKLCAIAGNDAHGNFNRFRQIGIPFLTIRESEQQLFGKWRTGVLIKGALSEMAILTGLANGQAIMTDGPVVVLSAVSPDGRRSHIGDTLISKHFDLEIEVHSTPEFGEVNSVRVIVGKTQESFEKTAYRFEGNLGFDFQKSVSLDQEACSYVRVESSTSPSGSYDGQRHHCFSNPIWIDPKL